MTEMSFKAFMRACNAILVSKIGMSADCLTDWNWRDAYDDGQTPEEAVESFAEDMAMEDPLFADVFYGEDA